MKSRRVVVASLAAIAFSAFIAPAMAGDVYQADTTKLKAYVQSNGLPCFSCHGINHKVLGPAWIGVAKKYRGNPNALGIVSKRIANGGSGLWGQIPMPPNQATPAQASKLAQMILALEPGPHTVK